MVGNSELNWSERDRCNMFDHKETLFHAAGQLSRRLAQTLRDALAPVGLQPAQFAAAIEGKSRLLIVEQTHAAQFYRYLRAHYDLPKDVRVLHRPGPLPIRPSEIHQAIIAWRQ